MTAPAKKRSRSPRRELLALLDAVRAAPQDDAPRLALAAWLEQHGDSDEAAHAAFIRVQCKLAQLPANDPRRPALRRREKKLRQAHAAAWLRPFSKLVPNWAERNWEFRRGLAHVRLGHNDLMRQDLERLIGREPWAGVEGLFAAVSPQKFEKFLALPGLAGLTSLHIDSSNFGGFDHKHMRRLITCPHLRRVVDLTIRAASHCEGILTPSGVRILAQSDLAGQLTSLSLSGRSIGPQAAETLAQSSQLTRLQQLTLPGKAIGQAGVKALARSPHLANLEQLRLRYISRAVLRALTASSALPRLRSLNLDDATVGPAPPYRLASWPGLARLTSLSIYNWRLGQEGVLALLTSPHATMLNHLNIAFNDLGPDAATVLASAPGLCSLTSLDLCGNRIGPEGVRALLASPHLGRLEELDLSGNDLKVKGMAALVERPLPPNLRRLVLWGNQIGPEGAKLLAGSPYLGQITLLDLHRNLGIEPPIGPEGAKALAASPHLANLTDLNVNYNAIGREGKQALERSPHLRGLVTLDVVGWDED